MAKKQAIQPLYMVSIYDDPDSPGALRFTFVPKGLGQTAEGPPPPQYIVSVQGHGENIQFQWIKPPPNQLLEALQEIASQRVSARNEWLNKLQGLIAKVKDWSEGLNWATRKVDKKMEDAEIGNYKAPGLLLQQETVRLFLEPVSRTAPGAEGIVDLYLMPSYDDIASLYFYNNRWNLHYMFEGTPTVATIRAAEAKPLTKANLQQVFDEMKSHAG